MMRSPRSDLAIYRRILGQARPYWKHIGGLFLLGLAATPLALAMPLPLKIVVDSVVGDDPVPDALAMLVPDAWVASPSGALVLAAALVLIVAIGSHLQTLATTALETWTGQRLVLSFRGRLFHHIQRLSLAYHDAKGTSDSTYRILYDAPAIQWIAIQGVVPFMTAAIMLVTMIWVIARIDATLAIVALAISPFLLLAARLSRSRLREEWKRAKESESSAVSVVQEALGALRVVKAFGQEEREHDRFMKRGEESARAHVRANVVQGAYGVGVGMCVAIGTAIVLFVGARHVLAGTLSLGNLVLVMGYIGQLYTPLQTIGSRLVAIQNSLTGADRAFDLLDRAPDVVERPDAKPIRRAEGTVEFDGVTFEYPGSGEPSLREVSFSIPSGSRVGIAGPTGAGKTTLASLLTRFYDPTEGRILLDGVDLRDYRVDDLRSQFGIVLQEPVLFSTTIAENIAYARPDASREKIEAAARAANAHDFIAALPDGYETGVGERGMRLSGGERQRVSLARAFLRDAPILILDEPTSSVDVRTETGIIEAMERLMKGRTTFTIAHRLSTLEECDVLLRIEAGRLVERSEEVRHALSMPR